MMKLLLKNDPLRLFSIQLRTIEHHFSSLTLLTCCFFLPSLVRGNGMIIKEMFFFRRGKYQEK